MQQQDYVALDERYDAQNYHAQDVVITCGEGVWAYAVESKRYLDCLSAYSALIRSTMS